MSEAAELIQGSDEWRRARAGSLGASQLHEAMAKIKTGWGASRANVMAQLLVERLTGVPTDGYMNDAMRWGVEREEDARAAYQFMTDAVVEPVGMIPHPRIQGTHASPDGLVAASGLLEIKCPTSATHIDTLLGASVAGKYVLQMQWQLACADRSWCDFVSYDPRMPVTMQLFIKRIHRDDRQIAELEEQVSEFLAELADKISRLRDRYRSADEPPLLKQQLVGSLNAAA